MNVSLIADYADILAALAIIASLVFVALQVRQNTAELKNSHWEGVIDRVNGFHARALDGETAKIIQKGRQGFNDLDDVERIAFEGWIHEFVTSMAAVRGLSKTGVLRPQMLEAADQRVRWMFRHQGVREWWESQDRVPFASDTAAGINDLIKTI